MISSKTLKMPLNGSLQEEPLYYQKQKTQETQRTIDQSRVFQLLTKSSPRSLRGGFTGFLRKTNYSPQNRKGAGKEAMVARTNS